jgi:hypothetical protein
MEIQVAMYVYNMPKWHDIISQNTVWRHVTISELVSRNVFVLDTFRKDMDRR